MADLVAVRVPTAHQFVSAWDRIAQLGDAVLPIDPHAPESAVAPLLRRTRPAALVTTAPGHPDRLRTVRMPDAEPVRTGTAAVVATSGSTGRPKAVVLSARALEASTRASLERLGCVDGERWLLCLPWHHVAGLAVVRRSRMLGVEPVLHDRFSEQAVAAALADEGVRWVSLVPTQLRRLLDAGVDLSGLRGVLLGGAATPVELLAEARDAGVRVTTSYGMSETCGGCVYDGHPLRGVAAEVRPDGRIRLSGDVVADGYHLDPKATAAAFADGGFTTSDLGRFDGHGVLHVVGRADDVVVSGGENVPTRKVAELLREHPDVADAVVVGLPDELWGHSVVAVVVAAGDRTPDLDQLRDHVGNQAPRAWAPRRLRVVDDVPRTGLGKPDAEAIRRLFEG